MEKRIIGKILSFLMVMVAMGSVTNTYAQDVTFTKGEDGKTLIVTGYGDLSSYQGETSVYKFNSSAVGVVYHSGSGTWSVYNGEPYGENNTSVYHTSDGETANVLTFQDLLDKGYLTETKTSGTLAEVIAGKLLSEDCISVKFVIADGHTADGLVLSAEQISNIISTSSKYSTLQDKASLVNLSQVTAIKNGITSVTYSDYRVPSILLPSNLNDEDVTNFLNGKSYGTIYWLSNDETTLNVFSSNQTQLSKNVTSSVIVNGKTNTIVYRSGISNVQGENVFKALDVDGIDNLDLHIGTESNGKSVAQKDFNGLANIKRVILPNKSTLANFVASDTYTGSAMVFQTLTEETNLSGATTGNMVFQTKSLQAGSLNAIKDAHYYNKDFADAICVDVIGNINDDDVAFFNGVQTTRLNLGNATYSGSKQPADAEKNFMAINNDEGLEYIVLPDLGYDGGNFSSMFTSGTKLKGVAQVNKKDNYLAAAINGKENAGTLNVLTSMIGSNKTGITKIKFSGNLNAKDITNNAGTTDKYVDQGGLSVTDVYLSNAGHWVEKTDEDKASTQTGALQGYSTIVSADFSDALFEEPKDLNLCFSGSFGTETTSVLLPTDASYTTIAHWCFNNMKGITNFIIPGNVKRIESDAFYDCVTMSDNKIMTTKTDAKGNGSYAKDMLIDNGIRSLTLPEKLEFIGTHAFWGDDSFNDVYVLAETAPECERDAFSSNTYTGNNGFDSSNGVSEKAYVHDTHSFAVLHYPSALYGTDEEKKYTDPTREYTLEDNTGATDANGIPLTWPSQVEWNHAYTTAYWGYIWGAWDKELSGEGKVTFANVDQNQATVDGWWEAGNHTDATKYTTKDYDYTKYVGWHQFILANRLNSVDDKDKPNRDLSRFKSNDWYTFCVPYNIHKSELLEFFGVKAPLTDGDKVVVDGEELTVNSDLYPIVSTLVGVKRDEGNGQITLIFSKDLVNEDVTINAEGKAPEYSDYSDDDPIIIKEGHPYLIKPYLPASKLTLANADKYIVKIADNDTDPHIYAKDDKGADRTDLRIPYEEHIVLATDGRGYGNPIENYTYRFGGAYSNLHNVPRYAYYLANSKSQGRHIWFYHSTESTKKWGQYSAIVAAKPTSIKYIPTSAEAKEGKNPSVYFTGVSDDLPGTAKAKYSMEFDDGSTTTGIKNINTDKQGSVEYVDGQAILVGNAKVYNISGQYVGNSLNGLAKGIYIVNGKKYVVK